MIGCGTCGGEGVVYEPEIGLSPGGPYRPCPDCSAEPEPSPDPSPPLRMFCTTCAGTGDSVPGASCLDPRNPPCAVCDGTGTVQ